MTVREWVAHWQEVYDRPKSRPTTYAAHDYVFKNHILPGLGEIPLAGLTETVVGNFLENRKRFGSHRPESADYPGLGDNTMRSIHRLLQQCLDQAVEDGKIEMNPARAFHYERRKGSKLNVLSAMEVEDYLDAAAQLGYLPMFTLALTAGLRPGELIALKWSDLNAKERTLTVHEGRSVECRETYQCWPSYKTIGKAVKMSPNTVRKYVAALEEKGLISTEATMIRRKDGRPMNGSLLYTIRPIQGAVEMFYARQLHKLEEDADRQRIAKQLAKLEHRSPCEPLCAPLDKESSPSPTQGEESEIEPILAPFPEPREAVWDDEPRTKREAG